MTVHVPVFTVSASAYTSELCQSWVSWQSSLIPSTQINPGPRSWEGLKVWILIIFEQSLNVLLHCRAEFRRQQRRRLTAYVELVVEGSDPLIQGRTTDDGVRYQSVVFAFAKSFDKITTLVSLSRLGLSQRQLLEGLGHSWRSLYFIYSVRLTAFSSFLAK